MKKILVVGMILALLFLVGCEQQADTTVKKAFIGGTTGLFTSFLDGAPPEEVFDKDHPFDVSVKVENQGEYDIPAGKARFTISGIDPADFGKTSSEFTKTNEDELSGAELDPQGNRIQGSIETIEFTGLQYQGKVAGFVTFDPIRVKSCYDYETRAQAQLCLREDLLGITKIEGTCEPNGFTMNAENSGAPVHVESLKEQVSGSSKIAFTFMIKHVSAASGGTITESDSGCDVSLQKEGKVWVAIEDPGIGTLRCSGLSGGDDKSGYTTLYNGQRSIRCTIDVDESHLGDYLKTFEIKLKYDYLEWVETALTVKHSPE